MIEEMSSIFWGLSLAFNIILLLFGLPLCLLICCCCKKHHGALEKDLRMLAKNHNILQNEELDEEPQKQLAPPQKRRIKMVQNKPVTVQEIPPVDGLDEVQQLDDTTYQMEDE